MVNLFSPEVTTTTLRALEEHTSQSGGGLKGRNASGEGGAI